jgi:hypothetical protein
VKSPFAMTEFAIKEENLSPTYLAGASSTDRPRQAGRRLMQRERLRKSSADVCNAEPQSKFANLLRSLCIAQKLPNDSDRHREAERPHEEMITTSIASRDQTSNRKEKNRRGDQKEKPTAIEP